MKLLSRPIPHRLLILVLLLCYTTANASNYHFSSSRGNDSRTAAQAQDPATPWKTLQKLNDIFPILKAGDSVLFKKGDIFYGYINVTASGNATAPIVLAAYGNGNLPVISGLTALAGWRSTGNAIYEVNVNTPCSTINTVLVNGHPEAIGRYPNVSEFNAGYLNVDSVIATTSITGPVLPAAASWKGAEIVIRKRHWVLDRNGITAVNGKTIQFVSETSYSTLKAYGFFVQNHRATLDLPFEWYFNSTNKKLGMYFGNGPGNNKVEASVTDRLLIIDNKSYITATNLVFRGANTHAVDVVGGKYIKLIGCGIQFSGNTAIHSLYGSFLTVDNCKIEFSNNNGLDIYFTNDVAITNNTILHTGTVIGSGKGNSGSYQAVLLAGDRQQVTGNTITYTGYIPITFNGNDITIARNVITSFGFIKDDGGGIYTWNNAANAPTHKGRIIRDNIILDGLGAPEGTADRRGATSGIYMDDNADNVTINNNLVARCVFNGLYVHNGHDLSLDSNTFYDNAIQAALVHDDIAPQSPLVNITFTNNICFSRTPVQRAASFRTIDADFSKIGTFDFNYYCRPLDEQSAIYASWKGGYDYFDLEGWQQYFTKDLHSKRSLSGIKAYTILKASASRFSNERLANSLKGLYVFTTGNAISSAYTATGPLDTGALKIDWTGGLTGNKKHASVIIDIGRVDSAKTYLLRYEEAGVTTRYIESYLRQSLKPYADLSERIESRVNEKRTAVEVLFVTKAAESSASIGLDITEQKTPVYIDNIRLQEVSAVLTNPDDAIKFLYNNTGTQQNFTLDGNYKDVRGTAYNGNISIPSLRGAILFKQPLASTLALLPLSCLSFIVSYNL